jgi:hypothetical protein
MMEIEASEWYRAALETECSGGASTQLTRPASSDRRAEPSALRAIRLNSYIPGMPRFVVRTIWSADPKQPEIRISLAGKRGCSCYQRQLANELSAAAVSNEWL